MKQFLSLLSLSFLLSSCASGPSGDIEATGEVEVGGISEVPNPSPDMAKKSGTSLETLERGHAVYMLT